MARLIGPGERKGIQPVAVRLDLARYDCFQHFICNGLWDEAPVETELACTDDRLMGGSDAVLVIDDANVPKKGSHSVGVAPQHASMLGKRAKDSSACRGKRLGWCANDAPRASANTIS
ncbi:SRSO17 transposase [Xanthobacter agilis]|uniref:SRSO17 transposase n=1 Tax=Xanthobacter agilis TaxID=47492 RepID=A0ABU0LK27_XANAG|nr:SRSO17 transposase [Xanthobacter agilis]